MSDKSSNDLQLPEQDAGALFRLEMWATNALLGYWKHLVAVIIVGLLAILVYGQYHSIYRQNQRALTAEVAEVWSEIPQDAIPGQYTEPQREQLRAIADDLARIGTEGSGPAATEAWLKAAEVYRQLGVTDRQRIAFEQAAQNADGALLFAARTGIATLALEAGDIETAAAEYRSVMRSLDGYLAQRAALDLGVAYEHVGDADAARAVYEEFLRTWPASPSASEVERRLTRLETAPAAALPPEAGPASELDTPEELSQPLAPPGEGSGG